MELYEFNYDDYRGKVNVEKIDNVEEKTKTYVWKYNRLPKEGIGVVHKYGCLYLLTNDMNMAIKKFIEKEQHGRDLALDRVFRFEKNIKNLEDILQLNS